MEEFDFFSFWKSHDTAIVAFLIPCKGNLWTGFRIRLDRHSCTSSVVLGSFEESGSKGSPLSSDIRDKVGAAGGDSSTDSSCHPSPAASFAAGPRVIAPCLMVSALSPWEPRGRLAPDLESMASQHKIPSESTVTRREGARFTFLQRRSDDR